VRLEIAEANATLGLPHTGRIIFDGDNRLRTLMIRGGQILLVEAQLVR